MTATMPDGEALLKQIEDAARNFPMRPVQHPQYVEGTLYVTPEQFAVLQRPVCGPLTQTRLLGALEIQVHVIHNDEIVTLPSGKSLMYSKTLSSLLIFDSELLP